MRILVISDIHANLQALETILSNAGDFDSVWCLGDLVGYGPNPNECISLVKQLPNLQCIIGNHDAAVVGRINPSAFNTEARQAIRWTQKNLLDINRVFLEKLPERLVVENVTLAHGSPRHPVWEYILDRHTATHNFDHFQTQFCFVGHTHLPIVFQMPHNKRTAQYIIPEPDHRMKLIPRAIINPGSVGQPRDHDPRAAFALFDSENDTWDYRRIIYDIMEVQKHMEEAGLPEHHIQRLLIGW